MQKRTFRRIFEQRKTVIEIVSVEVTWEDEGNPDIPEPNPDPPSVIIEGEVSTDEDAAERYPAEDLRLDPGLPDEDLSVDRNGPARSPEDCSLRDRP